MILWWCFLWCFGFFCPCQEPADAMADLIQIFVCLPSFTWALIFQILLVGLVSLIAYRRFFHHLKDIPGPALASVS
ncbi:hypothetical protein QBC38DRAFT_117290 [Podospora fimiseda]|uniref:Uncharacterized protein n=1 Tax=Podospora fimiseda TaxID=252190 RepID=A0AAN7BF55_9PEZI|nr:hypothetical protein QBC38DRAFT_117290 [Podospora fimiseda]